MWLTYGVTFAAMAILGMVFLLVAY